MKCLPAIIVVLVVLIIAEAKVAPASENQQTDIEPLQLSDYIRNITLQYFPDLTQIQENRPHEEHIANVKEFGTNLANSIHSFIANKTEEFKTKTPELENMWNHIKNNLSEAVNKLIPMVDSDEVTQLSTKVREGLESIANESQNALNIANQNIGKVQEDFKKIAKQIADMAVQNLSTQLQQSATSQPQT